MIQRICDNLRLGATFNSFFDQSDQFPGVTFFQLMQTPQGTLANIGGLLGRDELRISMALRMGADACRGQ